MKQPQLRSRPSRVLAVVGLAVFLSILDLFIVNIAFPDLRRDFAGVDLSGLSWVLTAYAIVFAAMLVPAGRLGDLYGRRRLFVIGLALFTLGSALCALAPSVEALIAARVLQGVGAAALTPNSLGLVLPLYPAEKRSTVIGAWAGIGAVGASIAPPLGGLLVEVSWRLIFIVNIPLGLIAIVLALRLAPEVRDARATRLPDLLGIAVLVAAVGLLTLGLTQGQHWGWDERVFGAFAAAAVLGAVFLRRCARHPAPVVELSLLRVPAFALAGLSTLLFSAGFAGLLLGNVLFFTEVWDYSILKAGIAFAPGPLLAATTAFTSGRLADGRQPAAFGAVGGFVFAAGCLWFITHATAEPGLPDRDPAGPDPHRHRRRAAAAVLHRDGGGHAAARPALDRDRRADDVPPDRRRARPRHVGGDRRHAGAGRRGRRVRHRAGRSWRSPRCSPGSPCCRWLVGGSSIHCLCDLRRDPRAVPELLRGARPQAPAVRVADPAQRPLDAAHQRGHAPAQAVLHRPRDAAAHPPDLVPEVLPHARHRRGRHHQAPPDLLRDARQLLDRRLLQAGRGRDGVGVLAQAPRLRPRADLDHDLRGRRRARPRPRRGGDRGVAVGRRAARADRRAAALGELLAGRRDRPVRPVLGALLRPRARVRRARTTSRAATTSASWSTGTSSSCSTTRSPRAS